MNATKGMPWSILLACLFGFQTQEGGAQDRLPSKPAAVTKLAVGQDFVAQPGQRRKLILSEDVTLLVNQGTSGKHSAKGEIYLAAGEVYVDAKNFTIKTGTRQIHITNGKAGVRVDKQGTSVVVTRGEATVAGVKKAIQAGYQLPAGATEPAQLPRMFHGLDWAKGIE